MYSVVSAALCLPLEEEMNHHVFQRGGTQGSILLYVMRDVEGGPSDWTHTP